MNLQGIQKMTLLDYPGKLACTLFFGGCTLRCPYCHNAPLVTGPFAAPIPRAELLAFLNGRRGLLDGVCLSGGEPLLQAELPALLEEIRALGFAVKLDTSGVCPGQLKELVSRDLVDYVAMDVKNAPARYGEAVGIPEFALAPVEESVSFLLSGAVDYEFRTTVVAELHDRESMARLGQWISGARRYFLQCYTQRDSVLVPGLHPPARDQMEDYLKIVRDYIPNSALRGVDGAD